MSEDRNIKVARLIGLEKKTREARNQDELNFVVANETRQIIDFVNSFLLLKTPKGDFNVKATYKNLFWLGTSYRHKESSIVMLGLKWEKISIGYAYDYSITNIRKYSSGSHEIMLGLDIETKDLKPSVSRFK